MQSSSVVTVTASIIMVTSIAVGFAIPFTTTTIIITAIITIITAGIITKITTTTGATIIIIYSGGSYEMDGGPSPAVSCLDFGDAQSHEQIMRSADEYRELARECMRESQTPSANKRLRSSMKVLS